LECHHQDEDKKHEPESRFTQLADSAIKKGTVFTMPFLMIPESKGV
jgi:hypothetical protein